MSRQVYRIEGTDEETRAPVRLELIVTRDDAEPACRMIALDGIKELRAPRGFLEVASPGLTQCQRQVFWAVPGRSASAA